MLACRFIKPTVVEVQRVPVPAIEADTDAIVAVHLAGICGSDLHPFHGREECASGCTFGHEMVGSVVQVGEAVDKSILKEGDMVMCPFSTACGDCFFCRHGISARCTRNQLFGWRMHGKGLHGCQAEYVRVPTAAGTLVKLPPQLSSEQGLLIGDIFTTGLFCATNAGLAEESEGASGAASSLSRIIPGVPAPAASDNSGDPQPVYVVVGCGPVGLCTVMAALELLTMRAERTAKGSVPKVFAVDSVPSRLAAAESCGAVPVKLDLAAGADGAAAVIQTIKDAAGVAGGAAAVMECVGAPSALQLAYDLCRPGATLSSVGVHTAPTFPFGPGNAYDRNITFKTGRCPARSLMPAAVHVMSRLQDRGINVADKIISHRIPLSQAVEGYRMFDAREEGCTKVVLDCRVDRMAGDGGNGGGNGGAATVQQQQQQ